MLLVELDDAAYVSSFVVPPLGYNIGPEYHLDKPIPRRQAPTQDAAVFHLARRSLSNRIGVTNVVS